MIKTRCKVSPTQSFFSILRQLGIFDKILNLIPDACSFCVMEKEEVPGTKL